MKTQAIRQARAWLKTNPLFLDTETTGLGNTDQIVEIAIIDASGKTLLYQLVKPTIAIPSAASGIHSINDDTVADAPPWPEVLDKLYTIIAGRHLIIYNAAFDTRMLRQSCTAHKLIFHKDYQSSQCAMILYTKFSEANTDQHWHKWTKLSTAATALNIHLPPNIHSAQADAELTRRLVLAIATAPLPSERSKTNGSQ